MFNKCRPRLRKLAEMIAKPGPQPHFDKVPATVGSAAQAFLAVVKARTAKDSFRVVPPKIARLVAFVGADMKTKDIGPQHWNLFVRWLRAEIVEKKVERTTAK